MNDLLAKIFSSGSSRGSSQSKNDSLQALLESAEDASVASISDIRNSENLAGFFNEVGLMTHEMDGMNELLQNLNNAKEKSKDARNAKVLKALRKQMDHDVQEVLKKARSIKFKLDEIDAANVTDLTSEPWKGSSVERVRIFVTNSLRGKLKESMLQFDALRQKMREEYREILERRYYTVTGQQINEEILEEIMETGDSEDFLRRAVEQQGKGQIMDAICEIQERHDAVKEMEENLLELHQVFLDMSVLVEVQGEQLNDIEKNILESASFVKIGTEQLNLANKQKTNSGKWVCIVSICILIIAAIMTSVIIYLVIKNSKR